MFVESLMQAYGRDQNPLEPRAGGVVSGGFIRLRRIHSPMILTKTLFFLLPSNSP